MPSSIQDNKPHSNDKKVVLVTRHGKGELISPILQTIGLSLAEYQEFDTDKLGTFSGEVERSLSPLECAREKAKQACRLTGASWGLGSEGSFGGGPAPGFMNWDEEILVLLSADESIEIVASAQGPINLTECSLTNDLPDATKQVRKHIEQFSSDQAWILIGASQPKKALVGLGSIMSAYEEIIQEINEKTNKTIRLIPDLRAHLCPERQNYITAAAQELADLWQSKCPQCHAPGFSVKAVENGLPCELCDSPTEQISAKVFSCAVCQYQKTVSSENKAADPQFCNWCNP